MLRHFQSRLFSTTLIRSFVGQHTEGLSVSPLKLSCTYLQRRWRSSLTGIKRDVKKAMEENYSARVDLAAAYRGVDFYKLQDGICNHLTLRAPAQNGEGDVMLVIDYGKHWKQVTASSLIGIDFVTGEVIEGEGEVEMSAMNIHRAIHRGRYEDGITCVMHTHQPYTTALACIQGGKLKNIHQSCMYFHNKIAYDQGYGGIPVGRECEMMTEYLGKKEVLMMGNHGVLVVGRGAADCFDKLYYIERAAQIQVLAMSTGKELWECSDQVAQELADYDMSSYRLAHFEAIKKIIAKVEPDFRS